MAVLLLADTDLIAKAVFVQSLSDTSVDNPLFFLFDSISSKIKASKIATCDHSNTQP